jgi:hypothetical protein
MGKLRTRVAGALFALIACMLFAAPGAQARKVMTPGVATLERTGTSLLLGGPLSYVDPSPGADLTAGLSVDADGALSAPAGSVSLTPDLCLPQGHLGDTDFYEFVYGYTNMSPCFPGVKVHWVTDELTGTLDPFGGAMTLHVVAHIQLGFSATEKVLGVSTGSATYTGDSCTIGTPPAGGQPLRIDLTTGSSGALTGRPYDEVDGTAELVDDTFIAGPVNCPWSFSGSAAEYLFGDIMQVPRSTGESSLGLGVRLDPIARRGVIAALTASPAGPGQAMLDASGTQAPAGVGSWTFDLDGDGTYETAAAGPSITVPLSPGAHTLGVRVADVDGDADTAQTSVTVADASVFVKPSNAFTLGKVTRNKKMGTATLTATVPNPGELTGSGEGVKVAGAAGAVISKAVTAAGEVRLLIKAKGRKKRVLDNTGKVKLKITVTYTPTGGTPNSQQKMIKLIKRLP